MIPRVPAAGMTAAASLQSYRGAHRGTRRSGLSAGGSTAEATGLIDRIVVGLMLLAVITTFTISPAIILPKPRD